MSDETYEIVANKLLQREYKPSVWLDGMLALAASVGVGVLTGTSLTVAVFALVAIVVGR